MAKFDIGINGVDRDAAVGREEWDGELPPTGNYEGILKVLTVGVITGKESKHIGESKLNAGVELRKTEGGKYDGYIAWGNLNLIDESVEFVNQFLLSLTDGSDEEFARIKKAFYVTKPDLDERKKNITDIGPWHIGSPEGKLPIKVALGNRPFYNEKTKTTTDNVRINSFLVSDNAKSTAGGGSGSVTSIVADEEPASVQLEDEDEALLDADEDVNA